MMAYQTGTVASAADLLTAIRAFAVANGWANSVDVLNKGGCYLKLTSPSAGEVRLQSAKAGSFVAPNLCPRYSSIRFSNWPAVATYHLVAFASPDTIWCTLNFSVTDYVHLGFGSIQKYGSWNGGQWFHAQHGQDSSDANCITHIEGKARPYFWAVPSKYRDCALFWSQIDSDVWGDPNSGWSNKCSFVECDVRGEIWPAAASNVDESDQNIIHVPTIISPVHKFNPNAFNGQTVLTPFELFLRNTDGHFMSIGHVDHVRFVKLTNYNPGDVIEIGPDRWKLFPWYRKDINNPDGIDGAQSGPSTGVLGVAVRYDGV